MDEIDFAQANEEIFRRAALLNHFRRCREEDGGMLPAARICRDCGDEIDADRRKANPQAKRCLECQTKKERRAGHG